MSLLDFGRRRVSNAVIDARRNLSLVPCDFVPASTFHCHFSCCGQYDGQGGTAPDPLVWSPGALPKRRRLVHAVRDGAFLPGPPGIGDSEWVPVPASVICAEDVAHWPKTTGILVKWVAFLGHYIGLLAGRILGLVASLILNCSFYMICGLVRGCPLIKAVPRYLRPGRPISVSAVPFGPGIDIWRSCRFIGALMRSLCFLPGGLGRFVPCSIGANHCRLRHIGW